MQVFRHINSVFASNTYILSRQIDNRIYVIDPGSDSDAVLDWIDNHNGRLAGIFLTHAHHDHIYGINDLLNSFPDASLYITKEMTTCLSSEKSNMSEYLQRPFTLNTSYLNNIEFLNKNCNTLLWNEIGVYIMYTPGHTNDSITFQIDNYIFSGDSLIPGLKIVYRKKTGGDSLMSANSCLLYTSDAADEEDSVDQGCCRI